MAKLVKNDANGNATKTTTVREGNSTSALRARADKMNRDNTTDGVWYTVRES
jgi:hypothetical protein